MTLGSEWYESRKFQWLIMRMTFLFSGHFGSWSFWWYLKWISWSWPWWYKWSVYIKILFETFKHWTSVWCPFGCRFLFGRLLRYRHSNRFIRYVQTSMFFYWSYLFLLLSTLFLVLIFSLYNYIVKCYRYILQFTLKSTDRIKMMKSNFIRTWYFAPMHNVSFVVYCTLLYIMYFNTFSLFFIYKCFKKVLKMLYNQTWST